MSQKTEILNTYIFVCTYIFSVSLNYTTVLLIKAFQLLYKYQGELGKGV
jgi:hypothetical protein